MEQLAQIPDKVIEKGADRLFDQGVLGIMLVVFIAMAAVAIWKLIDCHKTNGATAAAQAAAITADAAAKDKLADALMAIERRLEMIERRQPGA